MPTATNFQAVHSRPRWRLAVWSAAALLWLLPALAMPFTNEVNWTWFDFAAFGTLLLVALGGFEMAVRLTHKPAYRAAAGIALAVAFLLVWAHGAVGIF